VGLNRFKNRGFITAIVVNGWDWDAHKKLKRILPHLQKSQRILDVGSGFGMVSKLLMAQGFDVVGLDVKDHSLPDEQPPIIYDGKRMPFPNKAFDTCLVLTVLHHISSPEIILAEAKRVASQIIVIEDVYRNQLQKYLTFFFDSLFNWEFRNHPHTNKTHHQWLLTFKQLDLRVVYFSSHRFLFFFRQNTYVIEPYKLV
jgi:ubiquinone/menaquinone biosynthesis C-methylase UbiE